MKRSHALNLSCIAALASFAHAQQVLGTIAGQASGDRFGTSAITISDINGDGFADLAVGAPASLPRRTVFTRGRARKHRAHLRNIDPT
jgi:hypothetical protein